METMWSCLCGYSISRRKSLQDYEGLWWQKAGPAMQTEHGPCAEHVARARGALDPEQAEEGIIATQRRATSTIIVPHLPYLPKCSHSFRLRICLNGILCWGPSNIAVETHMVAIIQLSHEEEA